MKIQRPNIREQIFQDLDAFEEIAEFLENHTQFGKQLMLRATNALQQIEVGRLVLEVTKIAADNGIRLPNEIVMLGKALLNLDRVGRKDD